MVIIFFSKKMSLYFLITVLLLVFIINIPLSAQEVDYKLIDMTFKETNIRDVLRAIAELAEVNLIIDSSVKGNISVKLNKISFEEALKLITMTQQLAYKWDGNTVVVATPERITTIYSQNVTRVEKINHAKLNEVKGIISSVLPGLNLEMVTGRQQLIITGEKAEVNQAVTLIDKLDTPITFTKISKIIDIDSGDLQLIKDNVSSIYPDLVIKINEQNRQLIVYGREQEVKEARQLIEKLDNSRQLIMRTVQIKYGKLQEIKNNVVSLISGLDVKIDNSNNILIFNGPEQAVNEAVKLAGEFDNRDRKITRMIKVDYAELGTIKAIIAAISPSLNLQLEEKNRRLIIRGKESEVIKALKLSEKLDTPRRQVLIEVRIEEISRNNVSELGLPFEELSQLSEINFVKDDDGDIDGVDLNWPSILKILEDKGVAQTLANPRLMTIDGEEGKLVIGDQIPYPVTEHRDNGETITNYQYMDVGIILQFTPKITNDDLIVLNVQPKVSSLGSSVSGSPLPTLKTREAETKITLEDGQTFAIGGLIQDDMVEDISKIPFLSDIPVLGEVFKHRKTKKFRTEVIIFITPHIISNKPGETDEVEEDSGDKSSNYNDLIKTEKQEETQKDRDDEIHQKNKQDKVDNEVTNKVINEEELNETEKVKKESKEKISKTREDKGDTQEIKGLSDQEIECILYQQQVKRNENLPSGFTLKYIMQPGETIKGIAERYGVSNDAVDPQEQTESKNGTPVIINFPGNHLYRIKKGETLWRIANRFGFTVDRIKQINQIEDETNIAAGKIIVLPFDS